MSTEQQKVGGTAAAASKPGGTNGNVNKGAAADAAKGASAVSDKGKDDKGNDKGKEKALATTGDGWADLEKERFMWRAVEGELHSVHGYLLGAEKITPKKGKPFVALIVFLLEPTKAYDREGELISVPAGGEVLIPVTAKLQKAATYVATTGKVHEFFLRPTEKIDIGAGQDMWLYEMRMKTEALHPSKVPASASAIFAAGVMEAKRLGTGDTEISNDDIPF